MFLKSQSVISSLYAFSLLFFCYAASAQNIRYTDLQASWDTTTVLTNPHKGWYIHYYDNSIKKYGASLQQNDFLKDFAGLHHVYLRLAWDYLEPKEKVYNWPLIDSIIDKWVAKGYKISFRITCKETAADQVYATPEWVKDAGAKGRFTGENNNWEPEYDDAVFLQKLENFHHAFAARYESKPYLEYVDIGSYGDWGEGHTVFGSKKEYPVDVIKKHIDLYKRCYRKALLMISDDFITSRSDKAVTGEIIMQYILLNGITMRDDSVSVKYFADNYGFSTLRSQYLFEQIWRKLPVDLELEHYQTTVKNNTWKGGAPLAAAIEEAHASYVGFHGEPRKWFNENAAYANSITNKIGYWYFIKAVSLPVKARPGEKIRLQIDWLNRGVAPAYHLYKTVLLLKTSTTQKMYTLTPSDNRLWMPDALAKEVYMITIPKTLKARKVTVFVKLIEETSAATNVIALGMVNKNQDGFYNIGELEITTNK